MIDHLSCFADHPEADLSQGLSSYFSSLDSGLKTEGAHNCDHPQCAACRLSKAHRRNTEHHVIHVDPKKEMSIRKGDLKPGDCISIDQYTSSIPG